MTQRAVIMLLTLGLGVAGYSVLQGKNSNSIAETETICGSCDARHQRLARQPLTGAQID